MKHLYVPRTSHCLSMLLGMCLLAGQGISPAQADTVTLGQASGTISKDAMTFQNNPNNGSGGSPGFFSGTNAQPSIRQGYIAFDLSTIPSGATITEVKLQLKIGQIAGSGGGSGSGGFSHPTIGLYEMLRDWAKPLGETEPVTGASTAAGLGGTGQGNPAQTGDVTWNVPTFGSAATWHNSVPGGDPGFDYANSASASLLQSDNLNDLSVWLSTPALVADVQGWLNSPTTNFGWTLINADNVNPALPSGMNSQTFRGFYSRNYNPVTNPATPDIPSYWPQLIVSYQVPEPGSMLLLAVGMVAIVPLALRRKRAR